jgi:hypothetical protein
MTEELQKKSGAQPGNHNARKHGLYSRSLSIPENRILSRACFVEGLDEEIAVLRVKFKTILETDGSNIRLLNQTAETLARLYTIQQNLPANDKNRLKDAIDNVFKEIAGPVGAEISKTVLKS